MTCIIVVKFGGTGRGEIHRPETMMMVPREWSLLFGFIMYLRVTWGWPRRWCLLETGAVQGRPEIVKRWGQGLLSSPWTSW